MQRMQASIWKRQTPVGLRGNVALLTSSFQPSEADFELLTFRSTREHMCFVLSHQVYDNLL